jgi:hypothetical protein
MGQIQHQINAQSHAKPHGEARKNPENVQIPAPSQRGGGEKVLCTMHHLSVQWKELESSFLAIFTT